MDFNVVDVIMSVTIGVDVALSRLIDVGPEVAGSVDTLLVFAPLTLVVLPTVMEVVITPVVPLCAVVDSLVVGTVAERS